VFEELLIEILEGNGLWERNQCVSAGVAYRMFNLSFLVSLPRSTEMGFKEVMGAKGNKGSNFLAGASCLSGFLKGQLDGSPQIVVADPARNSPKMLERLDMTPEEALLFLRGKRHGKSSAGVAQAHDK
jgi:hypothetical protein